MKAMVCTKYGPPDVLQLEDVAKPSPKDDEVLVKVHSASVNAYDWHLLTAVCSPRNMDQARLLGADEVIDYTREDFTKSGRQYDLILAVNGYHPIGAYKRALNPRGIYVMAGGTLAQMFQAMALGSRMSEAGGRKMGGVSAKISQKDLEEIRLLIEAGKVKPAIDRQYPFSETAEALRHLGMGHARGKIVISINRSRISQ